MWATTFQRSTADTVPISRPDRRAVLAAHLRASSRVAALIVVSLAAGALCVAALGAGRAAPRAGGLARRILARGWARTVARVLGMRIRVEGIAPVAPCLLVANHLSYVDVITLWCATDGVFVAKSEVASWPLVGALGRVAQTLFVDRGRKRDVPRVIGAMQRALAAGESVILFGEGTSTRGDRVLPFKSSLFEASVRSGRPVACASLAYATPRGAPPAEFAVCWWGDMAFAGHAYELMKLRGFDATLRFSPTALAGSDRKALAHQARAAIVAVWSPAGETVRT